MNIPVKEILVILFTFLLFQSIRGGSESFVPSNSFEAPGNISTQQWQKLNDKFAQLIQIVNTTNYSVSYQLDNMVSVFTAILNSTGLGRFTVISVGESKPFSLFNVIIQDIETLAMVKFSRVDLIPGSMQPYIIEKIIITPDPSFLSSERVVPQDKLREQLFQIDNPLHLFYPYKTSDNEMVITASDRDVFGQTLSEKNAALLSFPEGAPVGSIPAATGQPVAGAPTATVNVSPVPTQLSQSIVGAGPLHPVGL